MEKIVRKTWGLFVLMLVLPTYAWSYVDPGTGSAVFGAAAYILAAGGTALAFILGFVKRFRGALFRSKEEDKSDE